MLYKNIWYLINMLFISNITFDAFDDVSSVFFLLWLLLCCQDEGKFNLLIGFCENNFCLVFLCQPCLQLWFLYLLKVRFMTHNRKIKKLFITNVSINQVISAFVKVLSAASVFLYLDWMAWLVAPLWAFRPL